MFVFVRECYHALTAVCMPPLMRPRPSTAVVLPTPPRPETATIGPAILHPSASHFHYAQNAEIRVQTFFRQRTWESCRRYIGDPDEQLTPRISFRSWIILLQ